MTDKTLIDFMNEADADLSLAERRLIVNQALLMIEQNYVHLPLKVTAHGVSPLHRLRAVQARLSRVTDNTMGPERDFHAELLEIFHSLRDLHTNYLLPRPFADVTAYLPFLVEEADGRFVVTALPDWYRPPKSATGFEPGVMVTHWNDIPIRRAVELNAARYAGSNSAARFARGLDSLTVRPLIKHLPPYEEHVTLRYVTPGGQEDTITEDWRVAANPRMPDADEVNEVAVSAALDLHAELLGRVKEALFAPAERAADEIEVRPEFAKVFRARKVSTASGEFGHLRVWTFHVENAARFVNEVIRLVGLLPQHGLIIDVRGNGGGLAPAAEGMLQLLTPNRIEPEPTQFLNSPLNLRLAAKHGGKTKGLIDLQPWYASMEQSAETGDVFSASFPITSPAFANAVGQRYHGPVVLVVDARCYSATDLFAAGFQDHAIGKILGTDPVTGAGGANVWTHQLLTTLHDHEDAGGASPYRSLPAGTGMRVAVRRSLRVGPSAGTPVEELGVRADTTHKLTRRDVLSGNVDLLEAAGALLKAEPVRRLALLSAAAVDDALVVRLAVQGFDQLDAYADGRPWASQAVEGQEVTVRLAGALGARRLRFEGYRVEGAARKLVAHLQLSSEAAMLGDQPHRDGFDFDESGAVEVPDLIGLGQNQAFGFLAGLGLRGRTVFTPSSEEFGGTVVTQDPAGGMLIDPPGPVVLGIGAPPVVFTPPPPQTPLPE